MGRPAADLSLQACFYSHSPLVKVIAPIIFTYWPDFPNCIIIKTVKKARHLYISLQIKSQAKF